jgi:hypothetical protein
VVVISGVLYLFITDIIVFDVAVIGGEWRQRAALRIEELVRLRRHKRVAVAGPIRAVISYRCTSKLYMKTPCCAGWCRSPNEVNFHA